MLLLSPWFAPRTLTLLALLTLAGCGGAEYKKRFEASKATMDRRAKFGIDLDQNALRILDQPWVMRFPKFLTKPTSPSFARLLAAKNGPGVYEVKPEDYLQPPVVKLPGLVETYHLTAPGGDGRLPYFLYLAVEPITNAADRLPLDKIRDDLKAFWPDRPATADKKDGDKKDSDDDKSSKSTQPAKPVEWSTLELDSLAGGRMKWERITASGPVTMTYVQNSQTANATAQFDLYKYESDGYRVLIGWLIPQPLIDNGVVKFEQVTPVMLGTLEFTGQKNTPAK